LGPDDVDAGVDGAQSPSSQPVLDRLPADSDTQELRSRDDPLLPSGQASDPPIELTAFGSMGWVV